MSDNNYERRGPAGTLDGTEIIPCFDDSLPLGSKDVRTTAADLKTYIQAGAGDAELAYIDGVTAGTAIASKAVVLDANKDSTGTRNFTADKFIGQVTRLFDGGSAPTNAATATATLTLTGGKAITPAARATSKLTSTGVNVSDNDTVVINTTTYRFKNATAQAYDVKIAASAALTLDNLKAAINASGIGDGTDYHTGTLFHPTVYATTNTDTTQIVVARLTGTTPNSYPTTTPVGATLSWEDTTLGGGTGDSNPGSAGDSVTLGTVTYTFIDILSETHAINWAVANEVLYGGSAAVALDNLKLAVNAGATIGTNYSTGTVVHPLVTATTNANDSQVFAAKTPGVAGNSIASTEDMADGEFGAATFASGADGTIGTEGEVRWDTSYLYICLAANTITGANWYKAQLTAV